jgi:quinolinate synthase
MNSETKRMYEKLRSKLSGLLPDSVLREKAELAAEIVRLKVEKNAVILGHNYMEPALFHSIPDFVGDSLGLSRLAAKTEKDIILFCGVGFMAETAKILSPSKKVLIPALDAGCSLAEAITAEEVRALRARFPDVPIVTYVNTYAAVKAESDYCCTSGNAAKLVASLDSDRVIFLPDEYLAKNVAREVGLRSVAADEAESPLPPETLVYWRGRCEVHERFTTETIRALREAHPEAAILAHPECSPEVTARCDYAGSTTGMLHYLETREAESYILLTECDMGRNAAGMYPEKKILPLARFCCPYMKRITLENVLEALREERYEVTLEEEVRLRALRAVERMLQVG